MKAFGKIAMSILIALFLTKGLCHGSQSLAEQAWSKGVEYTAQGKFREAKNEFQKVLRVATHGPAKEASKVIEDVTSQRIKTETAVHLLKGLL